MHMKYKTVLLCSAFSVFLANPAAQADTAYFALSELNFFGTAAQNNWPTDVSVSEPGVDGHFVWNYTAGDFQNGTGQLTDLQLPFTAVALADAIITIDNTGITGTVPGNFHNLTYDWIISFANPLTAPNQSATINNTSSTFDFTGTYQTFNGEWLGNISGNIIPVSSVVPTPSSYLLMFTGLLSLAYLRVRRQKADLIEIRA